VKTEPISQTDSGENQVVVYQPDETVRLDVRLEEDTVWLTQGQMTELFQRDRSVITRHINNVFAEGELDEKSNVHFLHIPFSDKPIKVYSLNVIISVGYRVKSFRGTQFRIWATNVLREYLLRGYAFSLRLNQLEDSYIVWNNPIAWRPASERDLGDSADRVFCYKPGTFRIDGLGTVRVEKFNHEVHRAVTGDYWRDGVWIRWISEMEKEGE